jgi:hypothetical protein
MVELDRNGLFKLANRGRLNRLNLLSVVVGLLTRLPRPFGPATLTRAQYVGVGGRRAAKPPDDVSWMDPSGMRYTGMERKDVRLVTVRFGGTTVSGVW